ncbi:hypothetical protein [Salinigranum sp.]|uniref:hypothetical protein n=1 Tax=Salinigranum sp. TaxID=1966351 RepID=UPI0035629867
MTDLTRREALRAGGIGVGGLALGGAVSGTAVADHGATGGTMLLLSEPALRVPFTAEPSFEFDFPASCFASESELKVFRELVVEYETGTETLAAIRTNRRHVAADGETEYEFTSSQVCRDSASPTGATIWKASFKPA